VYKLSPSDLTFTWDECKYCFYMKVKHGVVLKTAFPGIFGKMANLTSEFYLGRPAREISPDLPSGTVKFREKFVKSAPISVPGAASQCYLSGRFDAVIEFDDGSYGLVDYKTSEAREEHVAFYSRQLTAYAYALENPAPKALGLSPVSRMGLFIITPDRFEQNPAGEMVFVNRRTWKEVPRDDAAFLAFLGEVLAVLDSPTPPPSSENCGLCNYRRVTLPYR
jgi:PD-(D/E)XK nuclease superfamily